MHPEETHLPMPPDATHRTPVAQTVHRVLADVLGLPAGATALHDNANLFALGLDSLAVVRLLVDLEAELQIVLPTDELHAELFERLGRLVASVEQWVAQAPH